jgi:hypothetical protein
MNSQCRSVDPALFAEKNSDLNRQETRRPRKSPTEVPFPRLSEVWALGSPEKYS